MLHARPTAFARLASAFVSAWLLAGATALAQSNTTENYKNYLDYLNFHRARIDGEHHPEEQTREQSAAHADSLAPAIAKLDLQALHKALRPRGSDRTRILSILNARFEPLDPQLLEAEAELLALTRLRDDGEIADEDKPSEEAIEKIETKIHWLQEHIAFLDKERITIAGKPSAEEQAATLYTSLIDLEEARLVAENLTDPERKRRAEVTAQIQSQRLQGHTLAGARDKLPRRQAALAARDFSLKLKTIDQRLAALANDYPAERARLNGLRVLYLEEIDALKAAHSRRGSR